MLFKEYLLEDEKEGICLEDYEERKALVRELKNIDPDFFGKIRHFQPQVGCLNGCGICSKHASSKMECWSQSRQRNVIAAIKHIALLYRDNKPYISWNRDNHRSGVVFSYLDNDIGNYYYLNDFINLMYRELGVTTRISTVGYSRHNEKLNQMHYEINLEENLKKLAGFRLSFTPYATGWRCNNKYYSRSDYILDMANILRLYRPYYKYAGAGSRKMCVEIRYKPLVVLGDVYECEISKHKVIVFDNHIYISKETGATLKTSYIAQSDNHAICLTEPFEEFFDVKLDRAIKSLDSIENMVLSFLRGMLDENYELSFAKVYLMENADGYYYALNPSIEEYGNNGINIYPKLNGRTNSGAVITERFALNAILCVKSKYGVSSLKKFPDADWGKAYEVIEKLKINAQKCLAFGEIQKYNYIFDEIVPVLTGYINALKEAGYSPCEFFDPEFSIDTGIICNMGGALKEFKGITNLENEPLTPTHERNYGRINSSMTREKEAWRISCQSEDEILVQKLNLCNTATVAGQNEYSKIIHLKERDEKYCTEDIKRQYLIPGQRRRKNGNLLL